MSERIYDEIGRGYRERRRPDVRIAAAVEAALGGAMSVVNVGAGAGSYEPAHRDVTAVEVSRTMISQRSTREGVVQASATRLPFVDGEFEASLAILTVHHWPDRARGLREMARASRRRVVVLTWDPDSSGFWLVDDYFPEIAEIDRAIFPTLAEFRRALGPIEIRPVMIPADCTDGFLGAYWRRPEAYLDGDVRAAMSTFTKIENAASGVERLRRDLDGGTWVRRHGELLEREELDLGYRLVIAEQA